MAFNCLNNTKFDAPNGSPYYRDWSPPIIKSIDTNSNDESFPDHKVVCRSRYKMRCAASGKTIMPGDLITKIVSSYHQDSFQLRSIPLRIQYTTGYITDIHPERVYQQNTWCLRDEQPYTIGPDGYLEHWTWWFAEIYSKFEMYRLQFPSITFEEYAAHKGYAINNTKKRLDKAATEIQRMLRGHYFHKNLLPIKIRTYFHGGSSIMPGDRFVVATNTDSQIEYHRKVRVINKVFAPWGLARYKRWTITIRYDNGEIQTLVEDEFKYFLRRASESQQRTRDYAIDNNLPLKKHQIHEIVLNVRYHRELMYGTRGYVISEEKRELVRIVDILEFRGKRIVVQFFSGIFKVYGEKEFRSLLLKSLTALEQRPGLRFVCPTVEYTVGTNVLIKTDIKKKELVPSQIWAGTVTKILPGNHREVMFPDGDMLVYRLTDLQFRVLQARNYMRKNPYICENYKALHGTHPYQPGVEIIVLFDRGLSTEKVYRGLIVDTSYQKKFGPKSLCLESQRTAVKSCIMNYRVIFEDGDVRWYTASTLAKLRHQATPYAASGRYSGTTGIY